MAHPLPRERQSEESSGNTGKLRWLSDMRKETLRSKHIPAAAERVYFTEYQENREDSMSVAIPVFCKILDLVAIITQYYRNVNKKIQKAEILSEVWRSIR